MAFSNGQLQQLWIKAGGNPKAAPLAAAIALAESSGNPGAVGHNNNGTVDRGLWQINSIHGGQSTNDILGNVKAAIAISGNGRSWQPWTTFNTGAYRQYLKGPQRAGLPPIPGRGGGGGAFSSVTPVTSTRFDQAGFKQAKDRYLTGQYLSQTAHNNPWDIGPKTSTGPDALSALFKGGILGGGQPNPLDFLHTHTTYKVAQQQLQQLAGVRVKGHPLAAGNYTNPIRGAAIGRTDMGVDASGLPNGHPIVALGNSRVVGISPNWYRGQPYVLFQLLDGPAKGRYYYIAEAINPTVHPGQTVRAGQVVGTYNSSGTGLELGWGTPTPGRAAAAGHYSEGQVTAEGTSFRHFLTGLR